MNKILVILIALIGFSFSANAQHDCSKCTCSCGSTLYFSSQAYWTDCWKCSGDGVVKGPCRKCEQCRECETTGKRKCWGKQSCSSCGGTGCKNGYTTNSGKNCAYGYCSYCSGDGVKDVMDRWNHCPNCSYCGGDGRRDGWINTGCTSCGGNSQRAGTGGRWNSGCKCSRCGKAYTNCY